MDYIKEIFQVIVKAEKSVKPWMEVCLGQKVRRQDRAIVSLSREENVYSSSWIKCCPEDSSPMGERNRRGGDVPEVRELD